ncbi:unnamed protein product, partial [Amoebophrya sp. A120]
PVGRPCSAVGLLPFKHAGRRPTSGRAAPAPGSGPHPLQLRRWRRRLWWRRRGSPSVLRRVGGPLPQNVLAFVADTGAAHLRRAGSRADLSCAVSSRWRALLGR